MATGDSFTAWQDVAKYRAARKLLQGGSWGSLIFGVIAIGIALLTFRPTILHLGLIAVGGYLIAGFVMAFASPGVLAWVLGGTGLIVVGLWNICYAVADSIAYKARPHMFWAVLGALQVFWGLKMFGPRSKYAGIRLPAPSPEAIRQLDILANGLRKVREADGPDIVELMCSSPEPMFLHGKLAPEGAYFVDRSGTHVYFVQPADVELTLKKEGPLRDKNKCELSIRGDKRGCTVPRVSYERISVWKSGLLTAPPVQSPMPEPPEPISM